MYFYFVGYNFIIGNTSNKTNASVYISTEMNLNFNIILNLD